jgi:hypothetical protein
MESHRKRRQSSSWTGAPTEEEEEEEFEVFTAVVMMSYIFWDITPCSLLATCFHAGFLLNLFFKP